MVNFTIFILGSSFASFATCLSFRYLQKTSIIFPASHCDFCHKQLKFWQLIPIFGFFIQKGHCYFCKNKISPFSTYVEIIFPLYLILLLNNIQFKFWLWAIFVSCWCLILILEDLLTQTVSTYILYIGAILQLFLWYISNNKFNYDNFFVFILFFLLLFLCSYLNKLGQGDVLFLLAIVFTTGIQLLLIIVLLATILALVQFYVQKTRSIAFIPALSVSFGIILIFMLH